MIKGKFISGMLLVMLGMSVLQGCDAFRRLAGRPTSDEIAAKQEVIQREEAAHQARMDSLSRIEKAKALLTRPDVAIGAIYFQCGFGSESKLRMHFHRLTGMSPRQWRRVHTD